MRILQLNTAVFGLDPVPGEHWDNLTAFRNPAGHLTAQHPQTLVDYDVFIFDSDRVDPEPDGFPGARVVSGELIERVAGGGCLIVFAGTARVSWLPINFKPRGSRGERVAVADIDSPIVAFLSKYESQITYEVQFENAAGWTPTLRAMNSYPVAGFAFHGDGVILVLPKFENRNAALRDVLDSLIPKLLPNLRGDEPKTMEETSPDWLDSHPVAGSRETQSEILATREQIATLRGSLDDLEKKKRDLAELQGLLWYEGRPLEIVVEKTLNLLGIEATPRHPIDLVCPLADGGELYIEIEGTGGPIQIRKGRQLLGYIAEAEDPSIVRGAIIGNPFRKESPDDRPPSDKQVGLFSDPLKRLAETQKWKLVDTVKVFGWLKQHSTGKEEQASKRARKALGLDYGR